MSNFLAAFVITFLFLCTTVEDASAQIADQATDQAAAPANSNAPTVKKTANSAKSKAKKKSNKAIVAEKSSMGDLEGLRYTQDPLDLQSNVAFVVDQENSQVLFEKNANVSLPIASITKLMTSLVVLEANQDMDEVIEVTTADIDTEKGTGSRLKFGSKLKRADMLHIALMSSENRAASALGRNYPGGLQACVEAMNAKAKSLGMMDTHYVDSTGLSSQNMASAQDLAKLVNAAYSQPLIRQYSTDTKYAVHPGGRALEYVSSNRLTSSSDWEIGLQKTGYISEAGRCLVMQAMIEGRAVVMVFLDSKGKYSRFADASRMRKWLETLKPQLTKMAVQ
jgi:D-alanyl-D-alanine endopeptidase (penicillin-binding protein 7)